eukprot:13420701-Alexandrium_andersonii.AAC.1
MQNARRHHHPASVLHAIVVNEGHVDALREELRDALSWRALGECLGIFGEGHGPPLAWNIRVRND